MRRSWIAAAALVAVLSARSAGQVAMPCGGAEGMHLAVTSFGDLTVCVAAQTFDGADALRPHEWVLRSPKSVLETRRPGDVRRMDVIGLTVTYSVNGQTQPADSTIDGWRIALLDVLDSAWTRDLVRKTARESRTRIDQAPARRDSVRRALSHLRTQVAGINSQIVSLRSSDARLQSDITATQNRARAVDAQINTQESTISALTGSTTADARSRMQAAQSSLSRLQGEAQRLSESIRSLETAAARLDAEKKTHDLDRALKDLDAERKVASLEHELTALDSAHVDLARRELIALHTDDRLMQLDAGLQRAGARLRAILDAERR